MTRLGAIAALAIASAAAGQEVSAPAVTTMRVPGGGIQPAVTVGTESEIHLVHYKGEPRAGDLFYVRSTDGGENFSTPMRINSEPGSALAMGTIRGPHLALGRGGRVHVAWIGSAAATAKGSHVFLKQHSRVKKITYFWSVGLTVGCGVISLSHPPPPPELRIIRCRPNL